MHFDVTIPNEVHQADISFLLHDGVYKYALTIVDVARRYKQAEPLKTKSNTEVASASEMIYRRVPYAGQIYYKLILGKEFHTALHRDEAIIERFNWNLDERLFGY